MAARLRAVPGAQGAAPLARLGRMAAAPQRPRQRWGLPMPNWQRMRADSFAWWRNRVRDAHRLYDLFRIDHVVGLYRTFSFGADADEPGSFYPPDESEQRAQGEAFICMVKEE